MNSRFSHLWTISSSLILPIILMGILAMALVMVTADIFREKSLEDQKTAISELVHHQARSLLNKNLAVTRDLALSLNATDFKKAIQDKDQVAAQKYLDTNFSRYFVTAGIVKLEKLYVYDKEFKLISSSSKGSSHVVNDEIVCPELVARASARTGASRIASIDEICPHHQRSYLSVIVPVGGLQTIGYIQAVTDPRHYLSRIENILGFPIHIHLPDNTITFSSDNWPETKSERNNSLVSSTEIYNDSGETIFTIETSRNMTVYFDELRQTRNNVLLIAGLFTFVMGIFALMSMRTSTIRPVRKLMRHAHSLRKENIWQDRQADINGAREIQELANSFNEMTHRLSALYMDLSSSNENLAEEITERKIIKNELQLAHDKLSEKVDELNEHALSLKQVNEQLINENQQRILAERQLIKAKDAAESANKEKSQFLARMSHELRTPLNGILGYAQLMTIKAGSEEQEHTEWAKRIYDSGNYLLSLVNEILDLSTIEAGKIQLTMEPVRVMPLIEECIEVTLPSAEKRGIQVLFETEHCPEALTINTDALRFKQVLLNLLSNGVKYNNEGGKLTLKCKLTSEHKARFSIIDTGAGIDKQVHDQLFIPFNRLDADKKCIPGTGVGLSVSRQLTELMNGKIGFESEPGTGSTFWVEFEHGDALDNEST